MRETPQLRAREALRVPITRPVFGEAERRAVQLPLETEWVVQGPHVAQFEELFCAYTGASHGVATTSCTTALHLAVALLGLSPGDEVIVPAFTWVSTANVVEYMGATPVFCDIDRATFNLDAEAAAAAVSERTVGIIPVHLFGLCADMKGVEQVARKHGLWVLEDAACGFGGWQGGRHAGTFGDVAAFSFHPRKSITTGEGGMLTTANAEWAELARSLRDHGADRTDLSRHESRGGFLLSEFSRLGFNYRMTDLQAAVGCVQMERAAAILSARRERAERYDAELASLDWLATPVVPDGDVHGYQSYVCLFRPEEPRLDSLEALNARRDRLMLRLEQRGIATRQGTHAAALTSYYAQRYSLRPEQFPNAALAERLSLALPLYPQLSDEEQDLVVHELRAAFDETG